MQQEISLDPTNHTLQPCIRFLAGSALAALVAFWSCWSSQSTLPLFYARYIAPRAILELCKVVHDQSMHGNLLFIAIYRETM